MYSIHKSTQCKMPKMYTKKQNQTFEFKNIANKQKKREQIKYWSLVASNFGNTRKQTNIQTKHTKTLINTNTNTDQNQN